MYTIPEKNIWKLPDGKIWEGVQADLPSSQELEKNIQLIGSKSKVGERKLLLKKLLQKQSQQKQKLKSLLKTKLPKSKKKINKTGG